MQGEGTIEIYDPRTGVIVEQRHQSNVILDQGLVALMTGASNAWGNINDAHIEIGTGYSNAAETTSITRLDNHLWSSPTPSQNTPKVSLQRNGNAFTLTADIDTGEANGALTEAGIAWGSLFNRLMFRSPPVLPAGLYKYQVYTMFGASVSPPSNVQPITTSQTGAVSLTWAKNDGHSSEGFIVFRQGPTDNTPQFLTVTTSSFFIDAGFITESNYGRALVIDNSYAPPILNAPGFNINPQPKAVVKTADFAARIRITITFSSITP